MLHWRARFVTCNDQAKKFISWMLAWEREDLVDWPNELLPYFLCRFVEQVIAFNASILSFGIRQNWVYCAGGVFWLVFCISQSSGYHHPVTPLRDCLATPQRELTRKNQTVRFNVILLMRYGLNTRTRRHIQLVVHRTVLCYIIVDWDLSDLYRINCRITCRLT